MQIGDVKLHSKKEWGGAVMFVVAVVLTLLVPTGLYGRVGPWAARAVEIGVVPVLLAVSSQLMHLRVKELKSVLAEFAGASDAGGSSGGS